ncbi:hypothetical protein SAMN00790413_06011 [Deinococcus hopiensis KR-140]|uniref:Uncharacterized protein n=1 Tax=Deinococcus hopiensis KR-140 TaxID=695939 RepID=A0A1W1VW85_9DEIO|nr:hypothetical protein SAMN00790413_06011 [Deinococcus hopiensis KR-140]
MNYFIGLGGPTHYAVVGNAPWGWAVMSHPTAVRDGKQIFTTLHVLSLRQSDIRVQCNTYTIAFQKRALLRLTKTVVMRPRPNDRYSAYLRELQKPKNITRWIYVLSSICKNSYGLYEMRSIRFDSENRFGVPEMGMVEFTPQKTAHGWVFKPVQKSQPSTRI